MKVTKLSRKQYFDLLYKDPVAFMQRIHSPEIFIVQKFYSSNLIHSLRERIFQAGLKTEPSWHPLYDDCPDYHRLHDNYEKAYVKGKIHTYYHNGWFEKNRELFEFFKEIFEMKIFLAGEGSLDILNIFRPRRNCQGEFSSLSARWRIPSRTYRPAREIRTDPNHRPSFYSRG